MDVTGAGAIGAYTVGGQDIVLEGSNFGPTDRVRPIVTYGASGTEYGAKECSVLGHNSITCKTAPGTGSGHKWKVYVILHFSFTLQFVSSLITEAIVNFGPCTGFYRRPGFCYS